jgi:hypothetical protein
MGDETGGIAVGWVAVIRLPPNGWICAGVVENNRSHPVWALQVGQEKGAVFGDGLGDGLDFAHFEDFVADLGGGVGLVVDVPSGNPQTDEKQDKKGDSAQNWHNGTSKGAAEAGQFHSPIVAGWYPNARTA